MATRSSITIKLADGKYEGIYCHFDGYPDGVGKTLLKYYNTKKRVRKLVKLGSTSILGRFIQTSRRHDFDHPVKNVTVAYARDRGEDYFVATGWSWESVKGQFGASYDYLYEDDRWYVSARYGEHREKRLLAELVEL
jgi:hypothetical protein